jgi:23S rRNA (uracil1939-C5)-methyltransferase
MKRDTAASEPPALGTRLTVTIETLAIGGDGIAHVDGFTLFVPHTAPGDVGEVEVVKVAKNYGRAHLISLQTPSPARTPPSCPHAGRCAGCQLQHLSYAAQLEAKRHFVEDGLARIGRLPGIAVAPTLGMADPWHYRNKGEFIARIADGRVRLGYHTDDEDDDGILALTACPIQHPLSLEILQATEAVATAHRLPLAQLITRVSPSTGHALAILVCWEWSDQLPAAARALQARVPALAGVLWSQVRGKSVVRRTLAVGLVGRGKLQQHLGPWEYTVSAESFFQVNNEQARRLLDFAKEFATIPDAEILLDGYCGVGTFLVPLAGQFPRTLGIEEHPTALRDAEENLARYARHDCRLYDGRVEVILPRLAQKGRQVDVAVLDPPRKGAGRPALESLKRLGTERVVLISCDPATLGRDAGDLTALGYHLECVQPIDMFPHTWHVETIALAVREG